MAINTQQAKVDTTLAYSALSAAARSLTRAMGSLPPFSEQVRELNSIRSDTMDLAAKLFRVI